MAMQRCANSYPCEIHSPNTRLRNKFKYKGLDLEDSIKTQTYTHLGIKLKLNITIKASFWLRI